MFDSKSVWVKTKLGCYQYYKEISYYEERNQGFVKNQGKYLEIIQAFELKKFWEFLCAENREEEDQNIKEGRGS